MIVLKMHASFGKLNGELTLHEGLNVLSLPNESGKSTWSAFLLAMLYGIDTSEKPSAANDRLPVKERYKPWDGRSMQGRIELLHKGRYITIERRTQGRIPMGVFEAYDTNTGSPIEELTAENCGKVLCGVERSVFERTAFIRQLGMSVTEDPDLEKRMNALVTTGEEGISASELIRDLHERRVKLARSSTGRIPKLKDSIETLRRQLWELRSLRSEAMQLRAQQTAAQAEFDRLNALTERIERAKAARKHAAVEEAERKMIEQELVCARLHEQVSSLPTEAELRYTEQQLDLAGSALQTAQLEHAFTSEPPSAPTPPMCFIGLTVEQAKEQQANDEEFFQNLSKLEAPKKTPLFLSAAAVPLAALLYFVHPYAGYAGVGFFALLFLILLIFYIRKKNRFDEESFLSAQILNRYGVDHIDKTAVILQTYCKQLEVYEQTLSEHSAKTEERAARLNAVQTDMERILQQVRGFAPDCANAEEAKMAIRSALELHSRYQAEERALELQRTQLSSMHRLVDQTVKYTADPEALMLDEAKLNYERNSAEQRLRQVSLRLSEQNGKLSAMGDDSALQAQLEQTEHELSEAIRREHVLEIATNALKSADESLRSRFSPQITAEAAKILSEMTGGKYASLLLRPDMQLSVRENSDPVMHPAAAMSCGTADQMYLALRLAMVHRLLPAGVPILLDDALVNFDDERTDAALKLLQKEDRQIIFFSCKEIPYVL